MPAAFASRSKQEDLYTRLAGLLQWQIIQLAVTAPMVAHDDEDPCRNPNFELLRHNRRARAGRYAGREPPIDAPIVAKSCGAARIGLHLRRTGLTIGWSVFEAQARLVSTNC
jgi:hypothetical protein